MANTKNKELAGFDFYDDVQKGYLYSKLTEEEQRSILLAISRVDCDNMVSGDYTQRYTQFKAVYLGFLYALGWREEERNWREPETEEEVPLF